MTPRRLAAATAAAAAALSLALASPASAATAPSGTKSLAAVLTADGDQFDRNWYDYDIVTEAVLAVLKAKPSSPVGILADGTKPLTAFIPNDRAFQVLVADLTHQWLPSEKAVFGAVAGLGIDTVETVLLYHVVPGATITKAMAVKSNGAQLTTALGSTIGVRVFDARYPIVMLKDQDPNDINPFLNPRALDINKGNKQIAHGILFVLRPANL
ncbi:MAG TPA: fasciclin domain-containing protein [Dermatophilaceae bacterium]|nr:fasciclin domain-containing protein [Dermatophilaceae bacterium]